MARNKTGNPAETSEETENRTVTNQSTATETPSDEQQNTEGGNGSDGEQHPENNPEPPENDEGGQDKIRQEESGTGTTAETVKMVLKHKSHTPHYHRCGLTLTQSFAEYDVPKECVEKLKADKWIAVQERK